MVIRIVLDVYPEFQDPDNEIGITEGAYDDILDSLVGIGEIVRIDIEEVD